MRDVLIIGGGPVGASAALALAREGLDVAVVERREPAAAPDWDARVYAVSPGNVRWLDGLGAWERIAAGRRQAVTRMDVRGGEGRICFDAYEAHAAALTWIVENSHLQAALWACFADSGVDAVLGSAEDLEFDAGGARCRLSDGRTLAARLVLAADGARSWTRERAGIKLRSKPYGQTAVVANFTIGTPHDGCASQWFTPDGVLAWLPLPGRRMSMVWSTGPEQAAALLALPPDVFCRRVAAAGGQRLGALEPLTPPQAFELQLSTAERLVAPRLALIGDAGHTVHPLAGQGVNLGFRDVRELAGRLAARQVHEDIGGLPLLRRFERARAEDIWLMQTTCDALQRLFNRSPRWLAPLSGFGLSAVDRSNWLKRQLIAQAMI